MGARRSLLLSAGFAATLLANAPGIYAQTVATPPSGAATPAETALADPTATGTFPTGPLPTTDPNGAPLAENRAALSEIEASIALSRERADALRHEIDEMSGDRAQQIAALIAAAQRVKLAEIETGDMEQRLASLLSDETDVKERLNGANAQIANLLAAIERIGRNPPPALIVDPADALGSARSAILLSAILPQLRDKAEAVTADLQLLGNIKSQAVAEEAELRANLQTLQEERLRIATLIEARRQGVARVSAELEAEEQAAELLAGQATSLQGLIDSLSARITSVTAAAAAADLAGAGQPTGQPVTEDSVRMALADTDRSEPAIPFGTARGRLSLPATGVRVVEFGASDGFGGISSGLSLVTRAGAQVVAPADGWVMYKGPFLNYGQIVILNPGQDYTILLAGMDSVSVDIGQFVLMGEPVGTMGSRTIGPAVSTSAGNSSPTLYIEMRQNNTPLDPTGWWSTEASVTQSG
jgi:septal ring factor EnvC (AmiA/AmiB activator)